MERIYLVKSCDEAAFCPPAMLLLANKLGAGVLRAPTEQSTRQQALFFCSLASGEHSLALLRRAAVRYCMENDSGKVQRENSVYILES